MTPTATERPLVYVGFWARALAAIIDITLSSLALAPLAWLLGTELDVTSGFDFGSGIDLVAIGRLVHLNSLASFTLNVVLPAVAVILFWVARGATPGKMLFSAVIVDEKTLGPPTTRQWIARYLGYYFSMLPLGLGYVWIAFDARKRGFHDMIAGTVVIKQRPVVEKS